MDGRLQGLSTAHTLPHCEAPMSQRSARGLGKPMLSPNASAALPAISGALPRPEPSQPEEGAQERQATTPRTTPQDPVMSSAAAGEIRRPPQPRELFAAVPCEEEHPSHWRVAAVPVPLLDPLPLRTETQAAPDCAEAGRALRVPRRRHS